VLSGRLLGTDAAIPWTTTLQVKPVQGDSRQALEARLGEDHSFRLDVSALMRVKNPPKDLDLLADDPSYVPVQTRVSMRDLLGRGIAPEDVPVDVHVQPAAIAEGTLVDEEDRPVAGALVAATEPQSSDVLARATADANGHFRLRVSGEGEFR